MATIKDVAERAGVTVTTVSRVLNDRGYISQKTRDAVHKAMKELHYQPNELARALFRRKSKVLGLLLPSISHPFFAELTSHVESHAYKLGYKVLICNSLEDSAKEQEYLALLKRQQVAGIVMASPTLEASEYARTALPVVAIDHFLADSIPYVASDNAAGGRLAAEHLLARGCRHLAHISGPLMMNTLVNQRYTAFVAVAKEHGVPFRMVETKWNNFTREENEAMVRRLFEEDPSIDGVFASSDLIAASFIGICLSMGKRVPEDVKVIGYDDVSLASLFVPGITTIHQPIEELADLAVQIIHREYEGLPVEPSCVLPVRLVARGSTGP